MRRLLIVLVSCVGLLFVSGDLTQIFAQEGGTEEFTLEEITVTAQKREENQQKVPIAMTTISGEEVTELGYNNLEQILSSVSSVFLNTNMDGIRVSIRGMADNTMPGGIMLYRTDNASQVAVNVDGLYTMRRGGSGLYDLERVEVLYGPQSTMYASNSPGGIVNIVTADPKLNKTEMSGSIKYGNYNALQLQASMNAPVNDKIALRAAFSASSHDGYMSNGTNGEDTKSARIKTLYKPSEKFSVVLSGEINKSEGFGFGARDLFDKQSDVDDPWDMSGAQTFGPLGTKMGKDGGKKKIYANIDLDIGFAALTLVPAFSNEDTTSEQTGEGMSMPGPGYSPGTAGMYYEATITVKGKDKGMEMRLASSVDSNMKWIFGANWYKSEQSEDQDQYYSGYPDLRVDRDSIRNMKTLAAYGNVTYPVTDRFRVTGGGRYTKDSSYSFSYESTIDADGNLVLPDDAPTETEYNAPNYKLGLEYDLGPNSMFYTDVATSYRIVGGGGAGSASTEPEETIAYSLGSKNRFLENKLQVNISGFFYSVKNIRVDAGGIRDMETGQMDSGNNANGKLNRYGVDLQTNMIVTQKDKLDFSVTYLNSEFTDLFFDFEDPTLPDQNLEGATENYNSKWTLAATYSHDFNLPNGGLLSARLDTRYRTSYRLVMIPFYQTTDGIVPYGSEVKQEAYHIDNFNLTYNDPNGKWTLSGYVNNIWNYAEKKTIIMNSLMVGDPRTYGAILTVRY